MTLQLIFKLRQQRQCHAARCTAARGAAGYATCSYATASIDITISHIPTFRRARCAAHHPEHYVWASGVLKLTQPADPCSFLSVSRSAATIPRTEIRDALSSARPPHAQLLFVLRNRVRVANVWISKLSNKMHCGAVTVHVILKRKCCRWNWVGVELGGLFLNT